MFRRFNAQLLFETLGGFLLALVLLALFFASFATAAPRKGIAHSLALLPGSAEFVVSLDTFALRKSDLVAEMEKHFDSIPEAAENYRRFVQESGIDPRQDTDQVLLAMRHVDGRAQAGFLIVAQGRFVSSRLVDAAAEKGGKTVVLEDGTKIWTSQPAPSDTGASSAPASGKNIALAQPDPEILLFGEQSEVERVLEVLSGRLAPEPKDAKLRDLLSGVDRRAPAWAILNSSALAARLSAEVGQNSQEWKPGSAISKVESVTLMAWVGKDVDFKARVATKDSETAELVADMVRGALAAGKLAAKDQDPELLKILQDTKLTQDGTTLELEARIPSSRFLIQETRASGK
ncbi:MAG: hypothetical protein L0Z52_05255 [Acidobacteria bacterium]|nr:hypothetical protein [Acidobacteriota bacterium]